MATRQTKSETQKEIRKTARAAAKAGQSDAEHNRQKMMAKIAWKEAKARSGR